MSDPWWGCPGCPWPGWPPWIGWTGIGTRIGTIVGDGVTVVLLSAIWDAACPCEEVMTGVLALAINAPNNKTIHVIMDNTIRF